MTALQHVSIEVADADVDACARFYQLLGFELVEAPGALSGRATWLERDGTQIHLMRTEHPTVPPAGHHAILVDDYQRVIAALERAGLKPEPRAEQWGSPRSFVRNPAGHRVEVMSTSPAGRPAVSGG